MAAITVAVPRRGASCYICKGSRRSFKTSCCPPQGRELLQMYPGAVLLTLEQWLLSPAGARVVTYGMAANLYPNVLLSPAGARVVTLVSTPRSILAVCCCPPQGRELLLLKMFGVPDMDTLLSPAGARVVTWAEEHLSSKEYVAVPRRGASCYGKNAKNTMRIFGIPTIFLYYLLYFCVSIRDIVGFPRCEPACNNLIYCYYTTRFAPNQPLLHIGSVRLHS